MESVDPRGWIEEDVPKLRKELRMFTASAKSLALS